MAVSSFIERRKRLIAQVGAVIACLSAAFAWTYLRDDPPPEKRAWAVPIERDPSSVAAMEELFAIECSFAELDEEEFMNFVRGTQAGSEDASTFERDPAFREKVASILERDRGALDQMRAILARQPVLTFPEPATVNFADSEENLDLVRIYPLVFLFRLEMRNAFWQGRPEKAVDVAIEGVRIANAIAHGKGTILHLLVATTCQTFALQTLYSAAWLASDDPDLMRKVTEQSMSLSAASAFKESIIGEHFWRNKIKDTLSADAYKGMFPEEAHRFFWRVPSLFTKPNQVDRIYLDITEWLLENADTPQLLRSGGSIWEEIYMITGNPLLREIHPNAIGFMAAAKSLGTFEVVLDRHLKAQFLLECIGAACAVRSSEIENGSLPMTLQELVPKYLATIPIDPVDGEPVRYREGLLFGLGEDGIAQGAYSDIPFKDAEDPALVVPGFSIE